MPDAWLALGGLWHVQYETGRLALLHVRPDLVVGTNLLRQGEAVVATSSARPRSCRSAR